MALFASYEETGSGQTTGCESEYIDDIFRLILFATSEFNNEVFARAAIRNSCVISADVCAGYDSNFGSHFEKSAMAVCGKGAGIVPYLGCKRGNDTEFAFKHWIKKLAVDNEIKYSIETNKLGEGGGGTVSSFFAIKGCHVIDIGVPVLAMHSPQEVISKTDLHETYKLYKVFYESKFE